MVAGYIVGGTGPRRLKLASEENKQKLLRWLDERLQSIPVELVISGMAEGFDEALTKCALRLKLPVLAALPTAEYGQYYWGQHSVTGKDRLDEFNQLMDRVTDRHIECLHHLWGRANFKRNEFIVNTAEVFLAFDMPDSTGTQHALGLIRETGKPLDIYPQATIGGPAVP